MDQTFQAGVVIAAFILDPFVNLENSWTWEGVERKPAHAFWLARGRVKLHLIHMAWLKHEAPQHQQLLSGHNFPILKW